MKKLSVLIAAVSATLIASGSGASAQLFVSNPSFQSPLKTSDAIDAPNDPNSDYTPDTSISGWTLSAATNASYAGIVVYAGGSGYDSITPGIGDGTQGALLFPFYRYYHSSLTSGNATNNDGSSQGITGNVAVVAANTAYSLSVDVGVPTAYATDLTADYQGTIQLQLVDSDGDIFASQSYSQALLSGVANVGAGVFHNLSLNFVSSANPTGFGGYDSNGNGINKSDSGENLKINFLITNGSNNTAPLIFDNVQLSGAPEPSTYAMLFAGVGMLVFFARRRLA